MAASPPIAEPASAPEPGAPVPRDAIDPDLVKLSRKRPQIGVITAAGVVALCAYFLFGVLGDDRRFAGQGETPQQARVVDVLAGRAPDDSYLALQAEPMLSHAIRTTVAKGDLGNRVVPVRGSSERLWLVMSGDGMEKPILKAYTGRLRRIGDLKAASVLDTHATANPRPVFATAAAVRAGLASGQVQTVGGDTFTLAPTDRIAFDVVDPARAVLIATLIGKRDPSEGDPGHGPLERADQWIAELAKLGITATPSTAGQVDAVLGQVRLDVSMPIAELTAKLEAAKLWAARIERVVHHHTTTWGELRGSPATGFTVGTTVVPDAQLELVGMFVQRGISPDAYALIVGEAPQDYWHVLPITIALAVIGLLFAWALVRAVRELVPARAAAR